MMNWINKKYGHIEWEELIIDNMPEHSKIKYRVFLKDQNGHVSEKGRTTGWNYTFSVSDITDDIIGYAAGVQAGVYAGGGEDVLSEGEIVWSDLEGIPEPFSYTTVPKVNNLRDVED